MFDLDLKDGKDGALRYFYGILNYDVLLLVHHFLMDSKMERYEKKKFPFLHLCVCENKSGFIGGIYK